MTELVFITGGQRSGKSRYAQNLAESLSPNPMYLATSNEDETEFNARVARHQADRSDAWGLIEEPENLHTLALNHHDVVLLDCVTLWLSNIFTRNDYELDRAWSTAQTVFAGITYPKKSLIVVSNEIGLGTHAHDAVSRRFVDLQGWTNQMIARRADRAVLMVSGLPLELKDASAHPAKPRTE